MATRHRGRDLPVMVTDPTGELHGLPTYHWNQAPEGLATRRQLSARGLRPGGQSPVAQIRRRGLIGFLYRVDLAKPKRRVTAAKLAAVWTAARSRRRCSACDRADLDYIPQQGEPAFGRCWTCMGYPEPEPEPVEMVCPGCHDETEIDCPACQGTGGWGETACMACGGDTVIGCPMCGGF